MDIHFPAFRPHLLAPGGHLQTILGCYFFLPPVSYAAAQHRVTLPDGDQLAVHDDCPPKWQPGDPVALLVHGLGGSHLSGYMQRGAKNLTAHGVRVFRMDLRGCGAGVGLAKQICHAGRSADVDAVLAGINERTANSPTAVMGFSMGANMVLKLAGEWGDRVPANVVSVMAVSPPVDLHACCTQMEKTARGFYDKMFIRGLREYIAQRQRSTPNVDTLTIPASVRGVKAFDAHITAPYSGFRDVDDYYSQASSGPHLAKIRVPSLILAAADDPIVPAATIQQAIVSDQVKVVVVGGGGDLGYVAAKSSDPDCRWLDWRVVEWTLSRMPGYLHSPHWHVMQSRVKASAPVRQAV